MSEKTRRKKVQRLGRPKTGRKKFSHSLSLTMEQIEFLDRQPNASELIGKVVDELIACETEIESKLSVIALKRKIDLLETQLDKIDKEYTDYLVKYRKHTYKEGARIVWDQNLRNWESATLLPTPEAQYHHKVLDGFEKEMEILKAKIKELKEQFIQS